MPFDLSHSLTPAQSEAVYYGDGPLLILAGPGSGKTRVITHRIAHLIGQGVPSREILALTFTNKAADEMRQRLAHLVPGQSVWVSTFHRFCSHFLRQHAPLVGLRENFTIYDDADSLRALRQAIEQEQVPLVQVTPEQLAQRISWAKNSLTSSDQYVPRPGSPMGAIVAIVYPAYQRRLLSSNAADFDDLLLHVANLLRENPDLRAELDQRYRYILVDEYQDTNLAQYAIVRSLSNDCPNLSVTGDPDQSIYGWRGANLSNILDFEKDYPNVHIVRLEQNYRSTGHIVRVADQLISQNRLRKKKSLFTDNADGLPVRLVAYANQQEEADDIAAQIASAVREGRRRPRDFTIFCRVNALSRLFEHALADRGLPYQIVNGVEFYKRKEVKDVLAYLQLLNNPQDDVAFLRIINTPPRGIGRKTIQRLTDHARRNRISLLDAAREHRLIESLHKRGATQLAEFVTMVDRLRDGIASSVEAVVSRVLTESGYHDFLICSGLPEDLERMDNIQELVTAAGQYDRQHLENGCLEGFLEQAALVNDTDNWQSESDRVTIMTLHAAKGLEFPVVFLVAVEHGLIPHERSREDDERYEEERRLLFVGITRAEQELQLSYVKRRAFRGMDKSAIPSEFLMELPREEMNLVNMSVSTEFEYEQPPHEVDWTDDDYELLQETQQSDGLQDNVPTISDIRERLMTAADMTGNAERPTTTHQAHDFQVGRLVRHPEYGLGKITSASGLGKKRTATVQFFTHAERRTFNLARSPLTPVNSSG